jgi:hypothetical protein
MGFLIPIAVLALLVLYSGFIRPSKLVRIIRTLLLIVVIAGFARLLLGLWLQGGGPTS